MQVIAERASSTLPANPLPANVLRAGPDPQWRWAYAWGTAVAGFVLVTIVLHLQA